MSDYLQSPNLNPDQPTWEKPQKKGPKWLIVVFSLLILVLIVTFFSLRGGLIPMRVDDADLYLNKADFSHYFSQDNGFDLLQKAKEEIVNGQEVLQLLNDFYIKHAWSQEAVDIVLANNQKAVESFNQIADKKTVISWEIFHSVEKINSLNPPHVDSSGWNILSSLASLRSISLLKQERESESVDQSLQILKIGNIIATSQGTNLQILRGAQIQKDALRLIEKLASSASLSSQSFTKFNQAIKNLKDIKIGLINGIKTDYTFYANSSDMYPNDQYYHDIFKQTPGYIRWYSFKPDSYKKLLGKVLYRPEVQILKQEKTCFQLKEKVNQLRQQKESFKENLIDRIKPNFLGKKLVYEFVEASGSLIKLGCEIETEIALAKFFLLIKQSGMHLNRDQIPNDPFSDNLLKYLEEKNIIYSIGYNGIDDYGDPKDDIVVNLDNPITL